MPVAHRDFYYPLNVFVHILTAEEGEVRYLHYGLFERPDEPIADAQQRSTDMLLAHLPPPPARLLDAGSGIGTTLATLAGRGYDATGITPDAHQIEFIRSRHGGRLKVIETTFEAFHPDRPFDAIVFQESSQYIPSEALFARAAELTSRVLVLDEFAIRPVGALHGWDEFVAAAGAHGFEIAEQLDVSARAAPTIEYFMRRIPLYREKLMADLGLQQEQVDELLRSGREYLEAYRNGDYVYRFLDLRTRPRVSASMTTPTAS